MPRSSLSGQQAVYQAITDKIVAAVEEGAAEFVMPWHGTGVSYGRPKNAATGAVYRGVNVVALWAEAMLHGYQSRWWATYQQWTSIGGQVRRGEKGTPIVYYRILDQEPDERGSDPPKAVWIAKAFKVFNAAQVEGGAPWEPVTPRAQVLAECEEFVAATGAQIWPGSSRACYVPSADWIEMPPRELFVGTPTSTATETYYSTLFHELTHWSGAPHRLNRDLGGRFGTGAYAAEELVAELGAAFLCADFEVTNEPRPDHAAYVANWLQLLKSDSRAIFGAAQRARDAALYLERLWEDRAEDC